MTPQPLLFRLVLSPKRASHEGKRRRRRWSDASLSQSSSDRITRRRCALFTAQRGWRVTHFQQPRCCWRCGHSSVLFKSSPGHRTLQRTDTNTRRVSPTSISCIECFCSFGRRQWCIFPRVSAIGLQRCILQFSLEHESAHRGDRRCLQRPKGGERPGALSKEFRPPGVPARDCQHHGDHVLHPGREPVRVALAIAGTERELEPRSVNRR